MDLMDQPQSASPDVGGCLLRLAFMLVVAVILTALILGIMAGVVLAGVLR